jgi:hypothetical protein
MNDIFSVGPGNLIYWTVGGVVLCYQEVEFDVWELEVADTNIVSKTNSEFWRKAAIKHPVVKLLK